MIWRLIRLGLRAGAAAGLAAALAAAVAAARGGLLRRPGLERSGLGGTGRRVPGRQDWPPVPPAEPPAPPAGAEEVPPAEEPPAWVEPEGRECPPGHPVKAKLSSRIYHLPGMLAYDRTNPDRCYRDGEAAEADGLRRAKR